MIGGRRMTDPNLILVCLRSRQRLPTECDRFQVQVEIFT